MKPYKKATLSEIAEKLGVSKTLVSIVLNGKGDENGISKLTQEKVLKLAEELQYKPNQFARGLRLGKSNTIGLVIPDVLNPLYASIVYHIEDYCSKENYNLIICNSDGMQEKEKRVLETLVEKQVDGIIISPTAEHPEYLNNLKNENIPFVLIDRFYDSFSSHYVSIDNFKAANEATKYIINQGHKKIACLTISPKHISCQRERFLGYKNAIEESLLNFYDFYHQVVDKNDLYKSVSHIFRDWLGNRLMPTAILSASNRITTTILDVCQEFRINIPYNLSIVSFDDIDIFRYTNPAITAVIQPNETIAKFASESLIKLIKIQKTTEEYNELLQYKLEANLILRNSVAKFNQ